MKVQIVYWSGTGNTEKLANVIKESMEGKYETDLKFVTDASVSDIENADIVLLGCPAMGSEELEADDFQPFYDDIKSVLVSKKVGLFGTYEWADGEWMETWKSDAQSSGIDVVDVYPLHESNIDDFDISDFVAKF